MPGHEALLVRADGVAQVTSGFGLARSQPRG
jgi:hypothetical protein